MNASALPLFQSKSLFCSSSVQYDILNSTQVVLQDSMAKQTVDIVLNQIINCKGVFVTSECANTFRAYACGVNFPQCSADGSVKRPCLSMCTAYCEACFIGGFCPCHDLPETDCFTITPEVDPENSARPTSSLPGIVASLRIVATTAMVAAAQFTLLG